MSNELSGKVALVTGASKNIGKGIAVVICAFIVFVGSVYVLLSAIFGLRMAYLVLAVSFFGWMIVFSAIWAFGQPRFPPPVGPLKKWAISGTPANEGPRGTEPHWQVFAAGSGPMKTTSPRASTSGRGPTTSRRRWRRA